MTIAVKCRGKSATIIFSADRFLMHDMRLSEKYSVPEFWKEIQSVRTERKKFVDWGRYK